MTQINNSMKTACRNTTLSLCKYSLVVGCNYWNTESGTSLCKLHFHYICQIISSLLHDMSALYVSRFLLWHTNFIFASTGIHKLSSVSVPTRMAHPPNILDVQNDTSSQRNRAVVDPHSCLLCLNPRMQTTSLPLES